MSRIGEGSSLCGEARRELMRAAAASGRIRRHLEECAGCAAFARRFDSIRAGLQEHRSEAVPDAGFAARVTAALPPRRAAGDAVGWVAVRLLPAALALALALGVWCWTNTSWPADLGASAPTDDLLAWVLENGGEEP